MQRDDLYLVEIVQACRQITSFIKGQSEASFTDNELIKSAVLQKLMVIGEAAGEVDEGLRARYPSIQWSEWRGLRNVAAHAYFGIRWHTIWRTVTQDVPSLERSVFTMVSAEFPDLARRLGEDR